MRPRQTILLGLLLLVPVLAFLFLYGFGRNHYALPTYLPERTDAVRAAAGGGQRNTVYHRVRPFALLGAAGPVSSLSFGRDLCVVQVLGNTPRAGHAPGLMLTGPDAQATRALGRLQEKFRREPRVRLATLVPLAAGGNGEPAATLQTLAEQYGTISGKWTMLAAAPDTLARLARYELGLLEARPRHLPFRPAAGPDGGNLPAGRLLLLDRERHVRGYYDGASNYELERLITEINVLLYTYDDRH